MTQINNTVLMSSARYFSDAQAINPYMTAVEPISLQIATQEHTTIGEALKAAGVTVETVEAPENCQDGVYTANWALVRGDIAILASLPGPRQPEQAYAKQVLESHGKTVIEAPYRFSGQGDALPCGNLLFMGTTYRTDPRMHAFVADKLGYEVISLETVPQLDDAGKPQVNAVSGWPDSFFYDIDLALSVIRDGLIAWCPEAFTPESQEKLHALPIEKIEVSLDEAMGGFACNLVSTGNMVIMSDKAPELQAAIQGHGLRTVTPTITELAKGGGYIRCTTLTLDNS